MSVLVQSVDRAAQGWLRHRFSRALLASFIVLFVLYVLAVEAAMQIAPLFRPSEDLFHLFISLLIEAVSAGVGLLLVIGLVELVAMAIGVLPRRLIAVSLLMLYLFLAVLSLRLVIDDITNKIGITLIEALCFGVGMAFTFFVSLELCVQALWQLTVSSEGFRAASGWRPQGVRLLDNFRHRMGFPAFLSNFGRGRKVLSLLYFSVAVLNTGIAILLFMPTILSMVLEAWKLVWVFVFFGVFGGLLLLSFFGVGNWVAQVAARRATNIYQSVREWDSRPPVIFLRAFTQDYIRLAAGTRDPLLKLTGGVAQTRTFDEILLEHASPYGPVIAVGDPADPIPPLGAARIFVKGEGWHEVVTSLVGASNAIVMCPSGTEGVRWELNLIGGRGLFPRTVFLANPERSASETTAVFAEIANMSIETRARQMPVALFFDPKRGCRVLTAKRLTGPTYIVALNMALQALFGAKGVLLTKPSRTPVGVRAAH